MALKKISEFNAFNTLANVSLAGIETNNGNVIIPIASLVSYIAQETGGIGGEAPPAVPIELSTDETHILWRAVGTGTWNQLISLAEIKGDTGPYIEMQKTDLYIQWRVYGTLDWTNLVSIADLMGNAITSESINTIKVLTQEEFDLIGQKDNKTLYIVKQ